MYHKQGFKHDAVPYTKLRSNSPDDISGIRFGRLVVYGFKCITKSWKQHWICSCDCGNIIVAFRDKLESNHTESCGCLRRDMTIKALTTHNSCDHYLYQTWWNIKKRCLNKNTPNYKDYGGRGIGVYHLWVSDFDSFLKYITISIGDRPDGTSLDRIDNDKGYEPGNLRWATAKIQANNRRPQKKPVKRVKYTDTSHYFGEDYQTEPAE